MLRVKYTVNPVSISKLIDRGFKAFSNNLSYYSVKDLQVDRHLGFIAGCGHSGTTLLTAKLSNHPAVFTVGRESNNFSPLRNLYFSREIVREWCFTAEQYGKSHVIEKTPKHVHVLNRILRIAPEAKIILMIRNPLDTCSSLYKRFNSVSTAVKRWNLDNQAVLSNIEKYSNSVLVIRYEDLTECPEKSMEKIVQFLDLPWDEIILSAGETVFDKTSLRSKTMQLRRDQVQTAIRSNTGNYRENLSPDQSELVLKKTGAVARSLGYDEEFYREFL